MINLKGAIRNQEFFSLFNSSGRLLNLSKKLDGEILQQLYFQARRDGKTVVAVPHSASFKNRNTNPYWIAKWARIIVTKDEVFVVSDFKDSRMPNFASDRCLLDNMPVLVISRNKARLLLAPDQN